jgi:hypothetical protein
MPTRIDWMILCERVEMRDDGLLDIEGAVGDEHYAVPDFPWGDTLQLAIKASCNPEGGRGEYVLAVSISDVRGNEIGEPYTATIDPDPEAFSEVFGAEIHAVFDAPGTYRISAWVDGNPYPPLELLVVGKYDPPQPPRVHPYGKKPDLDERFGLPPDTDPDDVLRKLLGVDGAASEDVAEDEAKE